MAAKCFAAWTPGRRAWAGFVAAVTAASAATPAFAAAVDYTLDPAHSWVHFEVLHFSTSTIRGRIGPVQGVVSIDRQAQRGELALRLPTATVDTGLAVFNARIREADLLATEAWPEAFFVASRFRFESGQPVEVRGEFTLRGVSQPVSLRALRFACRPAASEPADGGAGRSTAEVCGGDFEGEINRADYGATLGMPFVSGRVRLVVQVEARSP
jgi:polyisoprenoid-binding protein YceI